MSATGAPGTLQSTTSSSAAPEARAAGTFRFAVGDRVRVVTHPARPAATVTARWPGEVFQDVHEQSIYAVSGFVTRQREASLAAEGFAPLPLETAGAWRMAGRGGFTRVGPDTVESHGGPGIWWYTRETFADFVLLVDWRTSAPGDNSGVFLRIPPLAGGDPDRDWLPAVDEGYEVQIDDVGLDHARGVAGSPRHRTGAIYGLAPAEPSGTAPGRWRCFRIEARGDRIEVRLDGAVVCTLTGATRRPAGHLGLQAHDPGSRVRFRNLQIARP